MSAAVAGPGVRAARARIPLPRPGWVDGCLALLFAAFAVLVSLGDEPAGAAATQWDTVTAPFVALPLLWRRTAPGLAAALYPLAVLVSAVPTFAQVRCGTLLPVGMMVAYSAAAHLSGRRALACGAPLAAGLALLWLTDPVLTPGALVLLVLYAAAVGAGLIVRDQAALAGALQERVVRLGAERDRAAGLAAALERERLARAIAEGLDARVGRLEQMAPRAPFAAIEVEARAALAEMRAVLRDMVPAPPPVEPESGDDPRAATPRPVPVGAPPAPW